MKDGFLYQKLYDDISSRIKSGEYPVGARLPDEKILSSDFDISAITVKKALKLLAEQGMVERIPGKGTFVRQPVAAAPEGAFRRKFIGVIFEHIDAPYGLSMLYKMDEIAESEGYKLIFRFSYGRRDKETEEIDFLYASGASGMVIMPGHGRHYNPAILKLVIEGFPVILVDKMLQGINVPSVRTDNTAAMRTLVNYMKNRGCRRIGLMTSGRDATSTGERRDSFYESVREHGMPVCAEHRTVLDMMPEPPKVIEQTVREIREYLVKERLNLDGIICSEYGIIPKLARACGELGIVLDKDLAVCCIDEDDLAPGGYTFNHMKQNEASIATKTMSLLFDRINNKEVPEQDYLIPAIFREKKHD